MIKEHSKRRLLWDVVVFLLAVLSCLMVPWYVVFVSPGAGSGWWWLYLLDLVFWIDIGLNGITSYRERGVEIVATSSTWRRYARSMLPVDLIANIPFEIILLPFLAGVSLATVPVLTLFILFRLFRVVRLAVILRRWSTLNLLNPGYFRVARFIGLIGLFTHWIACGWFLTAVVSGFAEGNWVTAVGMEGSPASVQYARSLYWTVTTMTTVGYGDITPHLTAEYYFAIVAMLLGASLYAYIIGSVASLLGNLQAAKSQYWDRIEAVTDYLRFRQVPHEVNMRVQNYYEYLWERYKGLKEGALLEDLPDAMRLEIMHHLAKDVLEDVPLFRHCPDALRDELIMSLQVETFAPGTVIAREGEVGKQIFFIAHGTADIATDDGTTPHGTFESGDYFGYFSLMLGERRTARVTASDYCEVLILTHDKYREISADFPEFREVMKKVSAERTERAEDFIMHGIVL